MEKSEQNRHLLHNHYPIPHSKAPSEEEEVSDVDLDEETPTRRRSLWRDRPWWQYLVLLQLANIIIFVLMENRGSVGHYIARSRDSVAAEYHDLYKSKAVTMYKGIDEGYWTRLQNKTFWNYLLLDKHGVVALDDWHLKALNEKRPKHPTEPPLLPADAKGKSLYQVAVFHSMHCLDMIHRQLLKPPKLTAPLDCSSLEHGGYDPKEVDFDFYMACHVLHCVDWVRQDVQCLANPALEPLVDEEVVKPNQCRSFDKVRDWALENQYQGDFKNLAEFG